MTRHSHSFLRVGLFAVLLALAGCNCGPKKPVADGGVEEQDAGFDAGEVVDSGMPVDMDGGVDAGEPVVLRITKVLPPRGGTAGGTQVLLEGSGFIRGFATRGTDAKRETTLKFGGNSVVEYQIIDDETLELRSPPGLVGPATVLLKNPNGNFSCNSCFTYFDELFVTSLTPKEGPLRGGNEVTIVGQGFTSDTQVVFGTFATPQMTLVDANTLKAVVPRGTVADAVDVVVYNKNGVSSQRRAYRYLPEPRLNSVSPLTGPISGGTSVVLTGQGLGRVTAVSFGNTAATSFTVNSETQITAVTPAASAVGAVDVKVSNAADSWTMKGAFTYVNPTGAFEIFSVVPHVARAGDTVTVTGQALDTAGITVSVGGNAATLGSATFSTLQFTVPVRGAAPRKSDVVVISGSSTQTLTQGFTYGLTLSALSPVSGPVAGGTSVTLTGSALPPSAEVFIGSLPATQVMVSSETQALALTPKGSGGAPSALWVRDAADLENEAVLANVFTFEEALSLGRVQPERGAIAGGTLVTVLGSGFGESTVVSFGANKAKDVKIIDSHTLSCRTPKGNVGTVDVKVERLGAKDDLPGGFSYFDPRSISGGLSGGPLVGTLNVTVLDGSRDSYGAPIPMATVMLGIDTSTPYQGLTDQRGQITFSDASLVKAQTVTVYKEQFQAATVTSVGAENLTVFITRTGGGGGNPSTGMPPPNPPPSVISGRVTGFKAPRPLTNDEALEARVFVSQNSFYAGPPFSGPPSHNQEKWVITQDGAQYLVFTNAGLHATYAVMGITNKLTGVFQPYLMGVCRGITTSPDNPATNQDIVLDMHLDLTVPITIDSPISISPGAGLPPQPALNQVYAWLDLGAEGFIPNPNNWGTGTASSSSVTGVGATLSFPNFPRLDGSNFVFLNLAVGATQTPYSAYFRRQPGDMSQGVTIGPMLPVLELTQPSAAGFNGTLAWNIAAGPVPQLHSVEIVKPTLFGNLTLWSVVLPGAEKQVVLPAPAVQQLRDEQAGEMLYVVVYSSLSPKFSYNQWTYDTLSGVSWSAFTVAVTGPFSP